MWSGALQGTNAGYNQMFERCVAFIIESISANRTISSIRVLGDTVRPIGTGNNFAVKPITTAWQGEVEGENLRLGGGQYLEELRLYGPDRLEGRYTDPKVVAVTRPKRQ